jgi:hypothetical protein
MKLLDTRFCLNSNNDTQEEMHVENASYAVFASYASFIYASIIGDPYPSGRGIGVSEKSCSS